MNNVIYVIFARQGFGYGEGAYPKEAHFFEFDAKKRVEELQKKDEDDAIYFYQKVRLVSSDNPIRE